MSEQPTLLYVEDSMENQILIKFYLKKLAITLDCADSAKEAIAYLDNKVPNLMIIDLNLPGELNSCDILDYMSQNDNLAKIPVIILSAMALDDIKNQVANYAIADFLTKPIRKKEFIEQIQQILPDLTVL